MKCPRKIRIATNPYTIFLNVLLLCSMALLLAYPLRLQALESLCVRVSMFSCLSAAIYYYATLDFAGMTTADSCYLIMLAGGMLSIAFSRTLYRNVVLFWNFLQVPTLLLIGRKLPDKEEAKRKIGHFSLAASVVLTLLSLTPLRDIGYGEYGVYYLDLTLGFDNPNKAAMILTGCSFMLLCTQKYRSRMLRGIVDLEIVYFLLLINETLCRTSYAVMLFVLLLYLVFRAVPVRKWEILLIMAVPFLYAALACGDSWVHHIIIGGHDIFTHRGEIYRSYFSGLDLLTFLLGDFERFCFQNLHHAYISILATVGVLGFIPFFCLVFSKIQASVRNRRKDSLLAICCFLGLILNGCTEAAYFLGGALMTGITGMIYLLTLNEP